MSSWIAKAVELVDFSLENLPQRRAHVMGVGEKAKAVSSLYGNDGPILVASAYLHDIGYSRMAIETGFHPLDGATYLSYLGFPKRICALVAHHSCAKIEASLRGLEVDLSKWPDEESDIRDALWWADMTTSPDGNSIDFNDRLREIRSRYGEEHVVALFINKAEPELRQIVKRVELKISEVFRYRKAWNYAAGHD
jgi:hypothetical protein